MQRVNADPLAVTFAEDMNYWEGTTMPMPTPTQGCLPALSVRKLVAKVIRIFTRAPKRSYDFVGVVVPTFRKVALPRISMRRGLPAAPPAGHVWGYEG